ncbi:MAG: glutamate ABC transporter substrate-binding protein [Mycobacteriales bacterium]
MRSARRISTIAMAAVLTISAAAACGDDKKKDSSSGSGDKKTIELKAGSTMKKLADAKKVKVGVKFDQPGFGQKDPASGKVAGFDVEIAKLIAAEMGIPESGIEFVETVSKNREPFIQEGKVDFVVATYTINDKRKELVAFAGPYYTAHQDMMVKKGNPKGIKKVTDLDGKKVCSVKGSTSEKNLKEKAPQATPVLFEKYTECAEELRNDKVDAVTTDDVILGGLIDKAKDDFELVGDKFTDEPYGIGVKKEDTDFRNFINDVLEKSYTGGGWKTAYKETVGKFLSDVPEPPKVNRY